MKFIRHFLQSFLPPCIIIIMIGVYIDRQQIRSTYESIMHEEELKLGLKKDYAISFFHPIISDIYYLANQKALLNYLSDSTYRNDILEEYMLFSQINKTYYQIRIIDTEGKEDIRVDYKGDSAYIVADSLLQDKSNHDYYKEAIQLTPNEIYLSPVELNMEFGKVEIPYKPVLRIAKALFDKRGIRKGFIIINYDIDNFIDQLNDYYTMENYEFSVLNSHGYWLAGPEQYSHWGFMFDDQHDKKLKTYYPDTWDYIASNEHGYIHTGDGLFIHEKLNMVQQVQSIHKENNSFLSLSGTTEFIMLAHIPPAVLSAKMHKYRPFLIVGCALLVALALSVVATRNKLKELESRAELIHTNRQLRKNEGILTQRNKELEQFVYVSTHDLQEPLRTISSFVNTFKEEYEDKIDKNANQYIGYIVSATQNMEKLLDGVLEYARLGQSQGREIVNCRQVIGSIKKELSKKIEETGAIITTHDLPKEIRGYENEIKLLFQHLISNAIKFRKENEIPKITINARIEDKNWLFSVSDNGIGIKNEYQERIFSMFQKLHREEKYSGTGMGLAQCRKIVEIHGGSIWVESSIDKGSTFYFTIPNN